MRHLFIFIESRETRDFFTSSPLLTVTYMRKETAGFTFEVHDDIRHLEEKDRQLLEKAKATTANAYAPYSGFSVGAAARMQTGEIVTGTNQENASYPAGLCAERVLLAAVSSLFPGIRIDSIAVSYSGKSVKSDHPVSPCGICRQVLSEVEDRQQQPLRLILAGFTGPVYIIPSAHALLPLAFRGDELP